MFSNNLYGLSDLRFKCYKCNRNEVLYTFLSKGNRRYAIFSPSQFQTFQTGELFAIIIQVLGQEFSWVLLLGRLSIYGTHIELRQYKGGLLEHYADRQMMINFIGSISSLEKKRWMMDLSFLHKIVKSFLGRQFIGNLNF